MLQRAVVMVLESVYEQDFRDCSFGFRPGRSAHQALQHLWEQRSGPRKLDSGLSEISIVFQAAVPTDA